MNQQEFETGDLTSSVLGECGRRIEAGDPETLESPWGVIRMALGIDLETLRGRVLDIGCGRNAHFVQLLRSRGIAAEGIDPRIEENGYLIKQAVWNVKPGEGHIPREDKTYDLVTAHNLYPVTVGLAVYTNPLFPKPVPTPENMVRAALIVSEGARVIKDTGRFVIYPSIGRTDYVQPFLQMDGLRLENQLVHTDISEEEIQRVGSLAFRTIITRE